MGNKLLMLTLVIIVTINFFVGCLSEENNEEDKYPFKDIEVYTIGNVIINISCYQYSYNIHPDNLIINVTITNVAGQDIVFTRDLEYRNGVSFDINTPSNLSINLFGYKGSSERILLKKNQSLTYKYDLIKQEFAESLILEDIIDEYYEFNWNETGIYSIKMSYLGPITKYEEIYSNKISFEITD